LLSCYEDEYSYVLDGTIGGRVGDHEVVAGQGTYVVGLRRSEAKGKPACAYTRLSDRLWPVLRPFAPIRSRPCVRRTCHANAIRYPFGSTETGGGDRFSGVRYYGFRVAWPFDTRRQTTGA
jgi:hypothetical protein